MIEKINAENVPNNRLSNEERRGVVRILKHIAKVELGDGSDEIAVELFKEAEKIERVDRGVSTAEISYLISSMISKGFNSGYNSAKELYNL